MRVDDVLPEPPEWKPISFGVIVQATGKRPWSFAEDRSASLAEIARRAAARGLPEVRYPDGWPRETYSLHGLRAAHLADGPAQLRVLSDRLFAKMFVEGRHLADVEAVLEAAEEAGMDPERVRAGIADPDVKERLRLATEDALARGVTGVPTVAVGEQLFWGDDRLEEAAAAMA